MSDETPRTPTTEAGRALLATDDGRIDRAMADYLGKEHWEMVDAILAIEDEARAESEARYAAQLNLTIKANSTIEDLREELLMLATAARAVLDHDEKERWGGPHDWLAGLIGYYSEPTE